MSKRLNGEVNTRKYTKRMMVKMAKKAGYQEEIFFERGTAGEEGYEKVKYILQHPGVRKGLEIQNSFFDSDSGKINTNIKNEALMKHVIFKENLQKTNWEYWEEVGMEEANFVLNAASKFLY